MTIELARKLAASDYAAPEQVAEARAFIRANEGYAAPEDKVVAFCVVDEAEMARYEAAKASIAYHFGTEKLAKMTRAALVASR
jgi:hypothetical protein